MKIAYLIDCEAPGGGCEYIRRKRCGAEGGRNGGRGSGNETVVCYSEKGECRARVLDAWGADEIVVNHLKALLQLMGRPWERPRGRVRFVIHGIHLRKYLWMMRECGAVGVRALPRYMVLLACFHARRMLETWLYHRCDEIVALTESDRADVLRFYGRKLKVAVEANTLEGWTPQLAEPSDLRTRFGQTRPQYVYIGRFNYQKGQDRWIRHLAARSATRNSRPPSPEPFVSTRASRTVFIGDGETRESCQKLAADLGVAEQCVFTGEIPNADRYLKCADIVVSASRWEGMPYLLMKARALGCRILATDCAGNREVLAGYDEWERLVP